MVPLDSLVGASVMVRFARQARVQYSSRTLVRESLSNRPIPQCFRGSTGEWRRHNISGTIPRLRLTSRS